MTAVQKLLMASGGGVLFDPLADIGWFDAFWAGDPDWSNPGDGNNISTLRGVGTDGTDWSVVTPNAACTFDEVVASGFNSQPAIRFASPATRALAPKATFGSTITETWSVVAIGKRDSVGVNYFIDGLTGGTRAILSAAAADAAAKFRFYTAANTTSAVTQDTAVHLHVGVSPSSGNNQYQIDNGTADTASVNAVSLTGSHIGIAQTDSVGLDGVLALVGYYSGDVRNDPGWSDFLVWAAATYGISIA